METTSPDYKRQAAAEAFKLISAGQTIGLGAGACVAHLVSMIAADDHLRTSLTLTSSSFKTINMMLDAGLQVKPPAYFYVLDTYFDGCDQFDRNLNALKSGGGIHTTEKLVASMAKQFVLLGEASKRVDRLDGTYPLVIELVPPALRVITKTLNGMFPEAALTLREGKDGALATEYGNYLLELKFDKFPDLADLNQRLKLIPGVADHSLFYGMATIGITAGVEGVRLWGTENGKVN